MEQPKLDALTGRIERMERQIRRWKILGIAAVAALGLVALLAGPKGRDAKAAETKEYNITLPPTPYPERVVSKDRGACRHALPVLPLLPE